MTATLAELLRPLAPIIGRWRSSGSVLDEHGAVAATLAGTDTYDVLPGGHWIAHEVDVRIGDERTLVHEVIGGVHPDGGWQMHAFGADDSPELTRLSQAGPGLLLLEGAGARSWFEIEAGDGGMGTRWERRIDGAWVPWMDMQFQRQRQPSTS